MAKVGSNEPGMAGGSAGGWSFGPFELRSDGLLLEAGHDVPIAGKQLALLRYLLLNRHRLVPREEVLAAVWPDVHVTPAAVASVVRDLRRTLGDTSQASRFIATWRTRGMRFVHPVEEIPADPRAEEGWDDLARHLESALRAFDKVMGSRGAGLAPGGSVARERGCLLVAMARARWAAGATQEARAAFSDAARVARQGGDAELLAEAALGFAGRTDVNAATSNEAVALLEEALRALPRESAAHRSEVLARLGTELYDEDDGSRAAEFTREAVALAERANDPSILAYALTSRHFVLRRPDSAPAAIRPFVERAVGLVADAPPSDVLALALQELLVSQLAEGDGAGFEASFAHYDLVVGALRQPFFSWVRSMLAGTRDIVAGRVAEAERAAPMVLELGRRIGSANAFGAFAGQLIGVRFEQGRLAELEPVVRAVLAEGIRVPIMRAIHVAIVESAGPPGSGQAALEAVMEHDLADFPRDESWFGDARSCWSRPPRMRRIGSGRAGSTSCWLRSQAR